MIMKERTIWNLILKYTMHLILGGVSEYNLSLFFLKVFEIRNTEDLTEEWLREKLGFFH